MKKIIILVFITLSFTLFAQNVDLFIWAGQSNALGRQGDAAGYPADVNNLDSQIMFNWTVANGNNSGGWTTMQPQVGYFPTGHFGPEVTFSRKLKQAGYNPAIFKYTQGATSIFQHWQGPGDGGLYDNMVTSLNTAITQLQNQGHTVTIRGFVWIQGESDSNSNAAANAYATGLHAIISDLRNNVVQNANLPIILGVDEQYFNLTDHEEHAILNAHQDTALNDADIKFTSMYGYPKADATHLTPAGLIRHGQDLFDAYQLLISGQQPLENCSLSSGGTQVSFERSAWGQSFTTNCSGNVSAISFSAASDHPGTATFTLHNGADCSGTVIFTQTLNGITTGNNTVNLSGIYLNKEHTYYMNIVSDAGAVWRINYSNVDNVFGVLRTNQNGGDCDRTFQSFDMNFTVTITGNSSCANSANIYPFTYNGKSYEIVKENKTWTDAAACAVERGGFLTEINNQPEQDAIYDELQNNAGITVTNTVAPDGGNASYVWIGANDIAQEGHWVWNGNNDANTTQFWQGGRTGNPVGGLYNNWGNEPDDWNDQDAAGIALTQWPVNSGSLGSASQWNDVDASNTLYFVIEYSSILNVNNEHLKEVKIYPNPVVDVLYIGNVDNSILNVSIYNALGQLIKSSNDNSKRINIDLSDINNGIYFVRIVFNNQEVVTKRIVK